MPRAPGRYSPFPGNQKAGIAAAEEATGIARQRSAQVREADAVIAELEQIVSEQGGKLPYTGLKQLRTMVGNEMADSGLMSDVPRSKWKALYGALTEDMKAAAESAGPQAVKDFNRANGYYRGAMRRMEYLDSVIEKNGGPEAVFKAATAGTKEGATTINAVMKSLPPEAQRSVSATVLRRMGRAAAGAQDDVGGQFSTERFLTNWNNLSPSAKGVLFDRYGAGFRQDMDQVAKVASNLRSGSKVFSNPSGTTQGLAQQGAATAFVLAFFSGNFGTAGLIAGGVGGANLTARVMTNPNAVKWLAKTTKAPKSALPALIVQAQRSDDPDLEELGNLLAEQQPE
jgi:hypothetical protein